MIRSLPPAIAAVSMFLLAACGSASDSITFAPPAGWTPAANFMAFMAMYRSPNRSQMLVLMKLPFQTNDLRGAMNRSSAKNVHVGSREDIKICGNQDAVFASGTADTQTVNEAKDSAQSNGTKRDQDRMDVVMTAVNGATYMAMYMRPMDAPADAAAEASIRQLCPKK